MRPEHGYLAGGSVKDSGTQSCGSRWHGRWSLALRRLMGILAELGCALPATAHSWLVDHATPPGPDLAPDYSVIVIHWGRSLPVSRVEPRRG